MKTLKSNLLHITDKNEYRNNIFYSIHGVRDSNCAVGYT